MSGTLAPQTPSPDVDSQPACGAKRHAKTKRVWECIVLIKSLKCFLVLSGGIVGPIVPLLGRYCGNFINLERVALESDPVKTFFDNRFCAK